MGGHVVMEKAAGSYVHRHEDVEGAKRGRDDDEEVAGHDHLGMIVDEGEPALLGIGRAHGAAPAQVLRDQEAESLAVPTQERVRLDIHQRVAPGEPLTQRRPASSGWNRRPVEA